MRKDVRGYTAKFAKIIGTRSPTLQIVTNEIIQDVEGEGCPWLIKGGRKEFITKKLHVCRGRIGASTIVDCQVMDPCGINYGEVVLMVGGPEI